MNMDIKVMMSDMSSTNLSFVKLLTNKRSSDLVGEPILVHLPFYTHPFVYMFDPHHSLKNLRNAMEKSIHKNMNILTNTYPLQTDGDIISWEHIEMLYNEDLDVDWVRHRTLSQNAVYLDPWTKQRVNLALDVFSGNVVSGLEYYKQQGHDVDGTLQYIKAVRKLLVGTFIDSTQSNGQYDQIKTMQNPILDRIRGAWDWFAQFQSNNADSNLSSKTYLAISSIRFGFERIVSDFVEFYRNIESERIIFLRPYRLTTNDVEMFFSQQRGRGCDRVDTYDKGVGTSRLKQQNQLEAERKTNTNHASIQSARNYNR
eukprot:874528_1